MNGQVRQETNEEKKGYRREEGGSQVGDEESLRGGKLLIYGVLSPALDANDWEV